MRWLQAAPAGLAEVAAEVSQPSGDDDLAWSQQLDDAEDRLTALVHQHYPDPIERIRTLLAWAGVPTREPTSGSTWYDMAVLRLLHDEPADLVLAALAAHPRARPNSTGRPSCSALSNGPKPTADSCPSRNVRC
ncbi:hypothetical protein ACFQ0T_40150 [Kitasatospora gansuensis]